jgi:hypothetical protein
VYKYGRIPIYYLDSSVYNELSHQNGRPDAVARLRQAKLDRKAYTYMSRYVLHELVLTYTSRNRDKLPGLMRIVREVAVPGRLVKDTPELLEPDIRRLVDRSVGTDILEPRDTEATRNLATVVAKLAADEPLPPEGRAWVDRLAREQQRRKDEWAKVWSAWRSAVTEEERRKTPKTLGEYLFKVSQNGGLQGNVEPLIPKAVRGLITPAELTRRLDETESFRSLVYYVTAAFYYQVLTGRHDPKPGDAFDHQHGIAAGCFDFFVSKDERSREYARSGCRGNQQVMTLDEFLAFLG